MGLTIHYQLHAAHVSDFAACKLVEQLQAFAKTLEFDSVSEIMDWDLEQKDDPLFGSLHHLLHAYKTSDGQEVPTTSRPIPSIAIELGTETPHYTSNYFRTNATASK